MEIFCFIAGVLFFYTKNIFSVFFFICFFIYKPKLRMILIFILAFFWGMLHEMLIFNNDILPAKGDVTLKILGDIISIPNKDDNKVQFQFKPKNSRSLILLSCYKNCDDYKVGQEWEFLAKLKKPRNLHNPGNFDYESFLKINHIQYLGIIKTGVLINDRMPKYFLLNLRTNFANNLNKFNVHNNTLGIVQALSLGISNNISKELWSLFRKTGTTHLMVISGAHIGFVAWFVFIVVRYVWSRFGSLNLIIPSIRIASVIALVLVFMYSLLAGFSSSIKRAFIACLFLLAKNFMQVNFSVWQAFRYALIIIVILEPHSSLKPGYYLSFIAVAILIIMNKYTLTSGLYKNIYLQICCLFGLMPFTLFWFSYGSINGFFANLLAIPLVGFIIMPLALVASIIAQVFDTHYLFYILDNIVELFLKYLKFVDSFAFVNIDDSVSVYTALTFVFILSLFLLRVVKVFYLPLVILICSIFSPKTNKIKLGDAKIDVLDVGQGLSVLIQTSSHNLIYDTGAKFYHGSDMGKLAIIPYLQTLGIKKLNAVIISHPDIDHRGGLNSIESVYHIDKLIVNNPDYYKRGEGCHQYKDWVWDGVLFHFYPIANKYKKNNYSCVLQVKNTKTAVLLTGDIEAPAENYLSNTYSIKLKSKFIIVPHHGSKTSSTNDFLQQVQPSFAIISYGYDNKYKFPHKLTIDTYKKNNITMLDTVRCGMISINLNQDTPKCLLNS